MIGVGHILSVTHRDPVRTELHGHSYEVIAWFEAGDAVELRIALQAVLKQLDHKTLSDDLTRAEAIAAWVGERLDGCTMVEANRPLERIYCRVIVQ